MFLHKLDKNFKLIETNSIDLSKLLKGNYTLGEHAFLNHDSILYYSHQAEKFFIIDPWKQFANTWDPFEYTNEKFPVSETIGSPMHGQGITLSPQSNNILISTEPFLNLDEDKRFYSEPRLFIFSNKLDSLKGSIVHYPTDFPFNGSDFFMNKTEFHYAVRKDQVCIGYRYSHRLSLLDTSNQLLIEKKVKSRYAPEVFESVDGSKGNINELAQKQFENTTAYQKLIYHPEFDLFFRTVVFGKKQRAKLDAWASLQIIDPELNLIDEVLLPSTTLGITFYPLPNSLLFFEYDPKTWGEDSLYFNRLYFDINSPDLAAQMNND
jgi:hypothetical protein